MVTAGGDPIIYIQPALNTRQDQYPVLTSVNFKIEVLLRAVKNLGHHLKLYFDIQEKKQAQAAEGAPAAEPVAVESPAKKATVRNVYFSGPSVFANPSQLQTPQSLPMPQVPSAALLLRHSKF